MKPHRVLLLALAAAAPAFAQETIDPAALAPLKQMSATLAAAKAFTFSAKTILEVPAKTGQFVTYFSTANVALKRPNKLRALLGGDAPHFNVYYDGASVTSFAPGAGVYSTKAAPDTIDAMLAGLHAETGIRFATMPLLFSNPYAVLTRGLKSAVVVGPSKVDGDVCEHLAFRSPGVNWEIWLEPDTRALPRRLAVTFTDKPGYPRTIVEFVRWNLNPWFLGDSTFVFKKPAGAKEIPFTSVLKSADRED